MDNYEKYIKLFNSLFTKTVTDHDFCYSNFDLQKVEVNYDDCISLYDLFCRLNTLHRSFIKEYEAIGRLDLAEKVYLFFFNDEDYRALSFYLEGIKDRDKYKFDSDEIFMTDQDGKLEAFRLGTYFEHIDLGIDSEMIKKYLDLFEKYQELFVIYNKLKGHRIHYDNFVSLYTHINNDKDMECGDVLDEMKAFRFCLVAHYYNVEDVFNLAFNMGDQTSVDYDETKVTIKNKKVDITQEEIINFLKSVYVKIDSLVNWKEHAPKLNQKVKKYLDSSR